MTGRMIPRLIGFLSPIDREFFDTFCSVDGVGVRKALRAMVRPVRELARTIQDQDVKMLATYPGHRRGDGRADRRQAPPQGRQVRPDRQLRRAGAAPSCRANGAPENAEPDVIRDTYAALLSVGHNESQARQAHRPRALDRQEKVQVAWPT